MRLPWEYYGQSQETNWRHYVTGPELPFFHKRKRYSKNRSVCKNAGSQGKRQGFNGQVKVEVVKREHSRNFDKGMERFGD